MGINRNSNIMYFSKEETQLQQWDLRSSIFNTFIENFLHLNPIHYSLRDLSTCITKVGHTVYALKNTAMYCVAYQCIHTLRMRMSQKSKPVALIYQNHKQLNVWIDALERKLLLTVPFMKYIYCCLYKLELLDDQWQFIEQNATLALRED